MNNQGNNDYIETGDITHIAPAEAKYLHDLMDELPANYVLNKGMTGCGATTVALEQTSPTIIAMPFVGLIQNKTGQDRDGRLLGIYGDGDKRQEIAEYMKSHQQSPKILTTYNSVPKVCSILSSLGYDPYSSFFLVIDEWHLLFNSYHFRNDAIRSLLETASKFGKVTYISATPIERKYWLEEIKDMPEYRIE